MIISIIIFSIIGCAKAEQNKVCFRDKCFSVELAISPQEQYQGLMFREHLDYDKGILFIFKEQRRHGFWMKDTYIPLDIIWLDQDGKVVFIKKNVRPCQEDLCPKIYPDEKAKYVLELNAGVVTDIGLKIGDRMVLDIQ